MSYTEDTALELAQMAFAEAKAADDSKIVSEIGELLGASSQSLEEAYSTFVRVLRAEERARALLASAATKRKAADATNVKNDPQT